MNSNLTRALDGIVSKVKQVLPSTKRKQQIERAAWIHSGDRPKMGDTVNGVTMRC